MYFTTDNTAIGYITMKDLNSCGANTALGSNALQTVIGDSGDTSIGRPPLRLTIGTNNIGLGLGAGDNITSGDSNVIIGGGDAASTAGDRQLLIAGYDGTSTTSCISGDSSGDLTFAADFTIGDDIVLSSDTSTIKFGADSEITLTHTTKDDGLILKHVGTCDGK